MKKTMNTYQVMLLVLTANGKSAAEYTVKATTQAEAVSVAKLLANRDGFKFLAVI